MALEDLTGSGKYIDDLVSANPAVGDDVSEGDDHIRGIKNVLKLTFPSIDGAITATDTELNYVDGVTSAIQTQLGNKLTNANDGVTVAHLNLISTSSVPSLEAKGDGSSQDGYIQLNCSQNSHGIKLKSPPHSANASYTLTFPNDDGDANQYLKTNGSGVLDWDTVDALPTQTSNSGKFLTTNGSAASWAVLDTDANTTTKGLYEMKNVISANYSIASGNNAMSAGPITINSNISVTVPSGSTWVIA